jgi:eukaryotic-like serine/threonine-protein kinase
VSAYRNKRLNLSETLAINSSLSHYRIVSKIGAGGMGEVYLAQDTKLDRRVALKILPVEVATNQDRLRRFVQEAKAASALNHPNIITIYEIEQSDLVNFIATEFIDGETLRERMRHAPMKLGEVLDVAAQIARALSAAHAAGIVHRDIKPENIMLRRDGIVKVLDFGLVKLTERLPPDSVDTEAPTSFKTDPSTVVGTAIYMSPEQARGVDVDARTDIFSLGVLIYEMIAGRLPFEGSNTNEILASILSDKEPLPLARYAREVPAELERIVSKTLRKNRDERYQTIKDLAIDLKTLRQELEFDRKLERSAAPKSKSAEGKGEQAEAGTIRESAARPTVAERGPTSANKFNQRSVVIALAALMVIASAAGAYYYFLRAHGGAIDSVAVMPFVNASGNADVEYLSDGMTETLISSLSQLPNLNVRPRSSVFRYKGKETNPQTIAKELNVQAILNGRVVQRGQDLSLFVELIDVALDKVVWSQQYNRKQADLVTLQTEIARDVSSRLKSRVSGADEAKITKTYTTNPEAYQLYLKGNYYRTKFTEEGYTKALEYYRQAIEIDPNYALAFTGIAYAYLTASDWYLPPNEVMPKVKAAALKALERDNTLAEAHILLGVTAFWYEWDWAACERELKRAIELEPNNAEAHHQYGWYLAAMGRIDQAIPEMELARGLAPLDLQLNSDVAAVYNYAGRYDQAIEQARKTTEMDRNYWFSYMILGLVYERKGQLPEAIAAVEKAHSLNNNPGITGYLGYVYAAAGKKAEAQKVLDELKVLSTQRYVPAYNVAFIYAGLNDKDQAFEWLNKGYEAHSGLALMKVETVFDNLRPDPRYKEMLKRLNLPE